MISSLSDFQHPFLIGIAGSGMSAIAQYLRGIGKTVSGSDRYFKKGEFNEIKEKLESEDIRCFLQDGAGINEETDLVIVSTAIEDTVYEVQKAKQLNIPILKRSELLALIAHSKKTIAVGGTSGKSTTSAMLFAILEYAGLDPGIISGAGLTSLIKQGKIGNAKVGKGDWLVIEADESDGSIVCYKPEIGLLLNIDKDHKEIDDLTEIFSVFKRNSKSFVVNQSHALAKNFSEHIDRDFSIDEKFQAGYVAKNFIQNGLEIRFSIRSPVAASTHFIVQALGKHNMENATAAVAVAHQAGVDPDICSRALKNYEGLYRRNQVYGNKNGVWLIDDYAHNPVKCAAAIRACQPVASKVIAWFQPHGYAPTKFLRNDFAHEITGALRPGDEIWMSEIFYAGGTTEKDISASDLIGDLKRKGANAYFIENRSELVPSIRRHITPDCVVLLMGARDPSLENFASSVWEQL